MVLGDRCFFWDNESWFKNKKFRWQPSFLFFEKIEVQRQIGQRKREQHFSGNQIRFLVALGIRLHLSIILLILELINNINRPRPWGRNKIESPCGCGARDALAEMNENLKKKKSRKANTRVIMQGRGKKNNIWNSGFARF